MCKQSLSIEAFKQNKKRSDGLQSQCTTCHKEYRRQHYLRNKQKYLDKSEARRKEFLTWWKKYKAQFKCSRCPENHPACIQFHHLHDKELGIATLTANHSKAKLLKELKKCIPLCANCHFKEHWTDKVER
jgi:hypothetical protein